MIRLLFLLASVAAAQPAYPPPYPPEGKLVDVGGYRVHLNCTGSGSPTVMIVGAGFSFDWDLVQSQVSKSARVCTYDASGMAWSDPGPTLTCLARVSEIHAALKNAGVEGPYVMVGLSMGAVVARRFAGQYPGETAGLVIVDHAFLNPVEKKPSVEPTPGPNQPPVLIYQAPIILTVEDTSNFNNLPARDRELHRWAMSLGPVLPTPEMAEACLAEVPATLGKMPLAVVSTGNALPAYLKLQAELLALSSNSRQFIADQSFHSVEIDQPEVVVRAIGTVLQKLSAP